MRMNMPLFAVIGFTFTTLCASLCPMNMGMMTPTNSPELAQEMNQGQQTAMPCKRCLQEKKEMALNTPMVNIQAVTEVTYPTTATAFNYSDTEYKHPSGLPLANAGPPLSELLVGIVILRT